MEQKIIHNNILMKFSLHEMHVHGIHNAATSGAKIASTLASTARRHAYSCSRVYVNMMTRPTVIMVERMARIRWNDRLNDENNSLSPT